VAVLERGRGASTHQMTAHKMKEILGSHPDFQKKKSHIKQFLGAEIMGIVYVHATKYKFAVLVPLICRTVR